MTTAVLAPPASIRLAVVDRDPGFVAGLDEECRGLGWTMRRLTAATLDPQAVRAAKVNALLVDPAGLGSRGWERLELLFAAIPDIAVVVCTGPSSVAERVRGLRLGADDWITKPCDLTELMVRIERISGDSRARSTVEEGVDLVAGEVELRPSAGLVRVGGRIVALSPREFELLRLFMTQVGQPLERAALFRTAWGFAMPWGDRSVDVYVLKLRRRLQQLSPGWTYIHTHHRYGYSFEARPAETGRSPRRAAEDRRDADRPRRP